MEKNDKIDLRSDTVTLPTKEMLESIVTAKLGDDVTGEDPTVNRLQEMSAKLFGTEAALLAASGTMGNLVSVLAHCRHGDEMVCEADSHIYYYEVGGVAAVAGVMPRLVKGNHGIFTPVQVREAVREKDLLFPDSTLLEIENTHNRAGGTCWTPGQVADIARTAHDLGMKVHIDGARIFNAAVALDVKVADFARHVDSVSFCLSKGLSCPLGSVIVGNKEFIEVARKKRKMLGGGLRQAGIIAAPGIIALNKMIGRLKEDHDNAKKLARALDKMDGLRIDMATVQTNIVVVDVTETGTTAAQFAKKAKENGVLISVFGTHTVRFVTHYGITQEDTEEAIRRIERIVGNRAH